jgi:hypothetical protein
VRPAQYAASGWAEPLNQFFDSEAAMMAYLEDFLPGPIEANLIDGTLYALPAFTDAQFLYYRADLLDKYGFEPPTTWEELKIAGARRSRSRRATRTCRASTTRASPARARSAPSSRRSGRPAATGSTPTATSRSRPPRRASA